MKIQYILVFLLVGISWSPALSQDKEETSPETEQFMEQLNRLMAMDSINKSLTYQSKGVADLGQSQFTIPSGFKFLDAKGSRTVLEELWGNPPDESILGMIFPEKLTPIDSNAWAFVITYENMGYVKDADANDINYDELMTSMQNDAAAGNVEREKLGYGSMRIVGWASKPFYDSANKTLHWAKEIKFGDSESNTVNYDVRVLGRYGVLSLNAVGSVTELSDIKASIPKILAASQFKSGNTYGEFDSKIDDVAAYTVGGLVAGKVLAKVGFLGILAKFGKIIFVALAAGGGWIWSLIRGRRKEEEEQQYTQSSTSTDNDSSMMYDQTPSSSAYNVPSSDNDINNQVDDQTSIETHHTESLDTSSVDSTHDTSPSDSTSSSGSDSSSSDSSSDSSSSSSSD